MSSVGRDSSVGIATELRAGRSVDRILSGGQIFHDRPDRPWGLYSLLYNGYWVFLEGKAEKAWRWPPTPSSAEVKIRVELHTCSFSGPSCPVIGWNFTRVFGDVTPRRLVNSHRRYGEAQCCLIQVVADQRRLFNGMTSRSRRLQPA
jgi:hypothetical protein